MREYLWDAGVYWGRLKCLGCGRIEQWRLDPEGKGDQEPHYVLGVYASCFDWRMWSGEDYCPNCKGPKETPVPDVCKQKCNHARAECSYCGDQGGPRFEGRRVIDCPELCNHANEVPNVCPCGPDCYCKTRSCWRPWTWSTDECPSCQEANDKWIELKPGSNIPAPTLCADCLRRRQARYEADPQKGPATVNIKEFLAEKGGTPSSPPAPPRNLLHERFALLDLEGLEAAAREPDHVRIYDFDE